MVGARKWVYLTDRLIKDWELLFNELNEHEIKALTNYTKTDEWYEKQLKDLKNYKKTIDKVVKEHKEKIMTNSQNAVDESIAVMGGMLNDTADTNAEPYAIYYEEMNEFNDNMVKSVVKFATDRHSFFINKINAENCAAKILKQYIVGTDENMAIIGGAKIPIKTTEENILDLIAKKNNLGFFVKYANGRKMGIRSYLEMNLRTTLQNIATQKLKDSTDNLGTIFFLASSHADCADDHVDYQGKIYVKENWQRFIKPEKIAEIQDFITKKDIKTMEWVIGKPVYFTTRPNCRHYFTPITIEQALKKSLKELHKELKTEKPMTSEDKELTKKRYAALQEQRRNERKIRENKEKLNHLETFKAKTKNDTADSEIMKVKNNIAYYQAKQRALINANRGVLVRDYKKEQLGIEKQ